MSVLDRLIEEKEQLRARIAEIDELLRAQEELERKMLGVLSGAPQHAVGRIVQPMSDSLSEPSRRLPTRDRPRAASGSVSRERIPEVVQFERVVRTILQEASGPLDRRQVLDLVRETGLEVEGNPPENVVSTRLSRMRGVSGRRGKGFFLTEREDEFFPQSASEVTRFAY